MAPGKATVTATETETQRHRLQFSCAVHSGWTGATLFMGCLVSCSLDCMFMFAFVFVL